jgi:hypothetical protein
MQPGLLRLSDGRSSARTPPQHTRAHAPVDRDRLLFNSPEPTNQYCREGKLCVWTPEVLTGLATWHYYTQVCGSDEPLDFACMSVTSTAQARARAFA